MTRASTAVFKSKVVALIDTISLSTEEIIGLGLTLAAAHAFKAEIRAFDLHAVLDQAVENITAVAAEGEK